MFVIHEITQGRMFGTLHVASEERALVAMVGSAGMEEQGSESLSRLLSETTASLRGGGLDDQAPARLAEALLAELGAGPLAPQRPSWLLYAAALVRPGAIDVCHAGDLRIQLQRRGIVERSTIDHTIGNMVAPGPGEISHIPPNVVMRSLAGNMPAPDRDTWLIGGDPGRLVITSSEVHLNRPGNFLVEYPDAITWSAGAAIKVDLPGS